VQLIPLLLIIISFCLPSLSSYSSKGYMLVLGVRGRKIHLCILANFGHIDRVQLNSNEG